MTMFVEYERENEFATGYRKATPTERVADIRKGIEDGSIEGEIRQTDNHGESVWMSERPFAPGTYIVIGPVSDGGEDAE